MTANVIPPLVKTVNVAWAPEAAFRRFTGEMSAWWPLESHSIGQENAAGCGFDAHVGGSVYEVDARGQRCVWGTVTLWEPPRRIAFTWHPGESPALAQDVMVEFLPSGSGTEVRLTHKGWEKRGSKARSVRRMYNLGWSYVLTLYTGRRGPLVVALNVVHAVVKLFRRHPAKELKAA